MDAVKTQTVYIFGPFRFDPSRAALMRGEVPIPLNSRALELLSILVAHNGEIMSKEALLTAVWPDSVVEEGNLTVQISALRRALGDTRDGQGHIVTVPGRGYRFVTPVTTEDPAVIPAPEIAPARHKPLQSRTRGRYIVFASAATLLVLAAGLALWQGGMLSGAPPNKQPKRNMSTGNYYMDIDPSGQDRRQTLTVLPFDDDTGDRSQLAATITNQVTDRLQSWMIGTPMTAAQFKTEKLDASEIARRLNIHFIVTGGIERSGDTYYVHYTLVDAPSDQLLLNSHSRVLPSGHGSMRPVLDQIAHNVQLVINRREVQISAGHEPDARDWVIKAQAAYGAGGVNRGSMLDSLDDLNKALALKPDFEPALRYDSRERAFAAIFHWLPDDAAELARAGAENQQLAAKMPENSFMQYTKTLTLIASGRTAEAMSALDLYYEPDRSVLTSWLLGRLRAQSGRLEEAKALLEEADRDEDWDKIWDIQASLAAVNLALSHDEEAVAHARKAIAIAADAAADAAQSWLVIASAEALRGNDQAARAALAGYRALPRPIPATAAEFARQITPRFAEGLRKAGFQEQSG